LKWLGLGAVREEPPPALAAWVNARADVNGRSIGATEERAAAQICVALESKAGESAYSRILPPYVFDFW